MSIRPLKVILFGFLLSLIIGCGMPISDEPDSYVGIVARVHVCGGECVRCRVTLKDGRRVTIVGPVIEGDEVEYREYVKLWTVTNNMP